MGTMMNELRREIYSRLKSGTSLAPLAKKYVMEGKIAPPTWNRLVEEQRKSIPSLQKQKLELGGRPGRRLKAIFRLLGVPPCKQCTDLANRMDQLGYQGCNVHYYEITGIIRDRSKLFSKGIKQIAAKRLLDTGLIFRVFPNGIIKGLVRLAIKRAKEKAL